LLPIIVLFLSFWSTRFLLGWRHVQRHGAPFHAGSLFYCSVFLEQNRELIEQIAAKLRVSDGSASEQDRQFHLVAPIEEPRGLSPLGLKISLANLGLDANFLELRYMLMTLGITFFPRLFVTEFPVVHESAHWRRSIGCNLYEVEPLLSRHLERIPGWNDPDLGAFIIDKSYLADTNSLVHASLYWSGNSSPPELRLFRAGHTKIVG
jgi:hypothetical protein